MPVLGVPLSGGRTPMIYLALRKSPRIVPLQRAPLIFRVFLACVAILVVMMAMVAVELQNEQFEGLADPSASAPDNGWNLTD